MKQFLTILATVTGFLVHTCGFTQVCANASDITSRPLITVPRTATAPVIDGSLGDACWRNAARVSHFFVLTSRRLAQRQTTAMACWDADNLYVAFVCETPHPDRLSQSVDKRDAPNLWQDDCVELFLDPKGDGSTVYHVIVNAAGAVYDESKDGDPTSWDGDVKAAVVKGKNNWTAELSIGLKNIEPALEEDASWGINFNRHATHPEAWSSWSPCDERFFRPRQFGRARFVSNAPSISLDNLGDNLGDLGKEGAAVRFTFVNPSRENLSLQVTTRTESDATHEAKSLEWQAQTPQVVLLPPNSQRVVRVPCQVTAGSGNRINLRVFNGNLLLFDSGMLPLRDRFLRPRIQQSTRQLVEHIKTLGGLHTTLQEVASLRVQLSGSLKTAYRLGKSVDSPAAPTAARWIEIDRKLRDIEDTVHDADVTLAILSGYTAQELKGAKMTRQYVLFAKPPFETILPDAKPQKKDLQRSISVFATPGEFEPATFLVGSRIPLKNVTVKVSDLTGESGVIPVSALNVRVLKYWWQAGTTPEKGPKLVMVPELLLKDDRVLLKGAEPDVPDRKGPITDIPAGSTKQFWLTISVPSDAKPGVYHSTLTFVAPGQPLSRMTLQLRVLPFILPEPTQFLMIEYRNRLEPDSGLHSIAQPRYEAEIKNIRDHGFHAVTLFDGGQTRPRALGILKKMSLSGPIPVTDDFKEPAEVRQLLNQQHRWKYPPFLFYLPEPVKTSMEIEGARKKMEIIRKGGGTTLAVTSLKGAAELRDVLDIPCYSVSDPGFVKYVKDRESGAAAILAGKECYTWEAMQENPAINRLFCGYYLWKSGMQGILPQTYQDVISGDDPFNDSAGVTLRQRMITYPSKQGSIDTIQWEAARAGIDDLRYLCLLHQLVEGLRNLKRPGLSDAVDNADQTINKISSLIQTDYRLTLRDLKPRDYQKLRWQVAAAILKISEAIGK